METVEAFPGVGGWARKSLSRFHSWTAVASIAVLVLTLPASNQKMARSHVSTRPTDVPFAVQGRRHNCRAWRYALQRSAGLKTGRDSFRWPLIEQSAGCYDWSSVEGMVSASVVNHMQVIWDLCHFGVPDCVDASGLDFPLRFAAYAREAAKLVRSLDGRPQWWCPINEISYWAHAAGQQSYMQPTLEGRRGFLKIQFAQAYLAAKAAIQAVDPRSRFVATDPLICVSDPGGDICNAERDYGYEAWDKDLRTFGHCGRTRAAGTTVSCL
jgi:hypothetical protein